MNSIKNNVYDMWLDIRANWRNALACHILATIIAYILLTPLASLLLNIAVSRSGDSALSDQEILFFFLKPFGLGCLVLLGAIAIAIIAFKHATLMTILQAANRGQIVTYTQAIFFISRRSLQILRLGMYMVARLLIYILPLLAASWLVFQYFLSEHDVNYYLAQKPTEFWLAAALVGIFLTITAVLAMRLVIPWVYSLPLVLFDNNSTSEALASSRQTAAGNGKVILFWILVWIALDALLLSIAMGTMSAVGSLLVPHAVDSIRLLVLTLGLVLLLGARLALAATFLSAAYFSAIILHLYRSAGLNSNSDQADKDTLAAALETAALRTNKPWLNRRWTVIGSLAALVLAALSSKQLLDRLTIEDHVQIIAHRGASAVAPENTIASISQALEQGSDWVEIDVQESADGEVVVIHDRDLKKVGGVDLNVYASSLAQLQAVDIGSWFSSAFSDQRIATLEQVLLLCKGRAGVNIELKYYGHEQQLEQRVADIVAATGMEQNIVLMSLSYKGISRMRALRPQWTMGLLSSVTAGDLSGLQLDFYAINAGFANRAFVREAHNNDRQVFVWTVNDAVGMSKMMSRGVDGIITDEPALARSVLEQRASLSSGERLLIELATLLGHKAAYLKQ
jgi:glycerophosphoryl diester phosphodiesterase